MKNGRSAGEPRQEERIVSLRNQGDRHSWYGVHSSDLFSFRLPARPESEGSELSRHRLPQVPAPGPSAEEVFLAT